MNKKNAVDNIAIIVVFFNPSNQHKKNISRLAECGLRVIAVDNSTNAFRETTPYIYIPLNRNEGIAAAQNVGINYALRNGFGYVILLDQDSIINISYVEKIFEDFVNIKNSDPHIGFLGPIFVDRDSNQEYKNYTDKKKQYSKVSAIIASGSLISLEALEKVGLMDESLFIDLVDFEWCWRANSMGYSGYMTRKVQMLHSIGKEYHNWHGFVLGISAPFRYFYQYRNTLWLCKRDYVPFRWKVKSILRRTLDLLLVPLVSNEGIKCFKFMTKGIKMGLFYKNTPLYQFYD